MKACKCGFCENDMVPLTTSKDCRNSHFVKPYEEWIVIGGCHGICLITTDELKEYRKGVLLALLLALPFIILNLLIIFDLKG
jgi:hypothetical protein